MVTILLKTRVKIQYSKSMIHFGETVITVMLWKGNMNRAYKVPLGNMICHSRSIIAHRKAGYPLYAKRERTKLWTRVDSLTSIQHILDDKETLISSEKERV
jgi:hypothetical protein